MSPFQIVHDRLAALTDKRLARMNLWDKELNCGCAIGSILPKELRQSGSAVIEDDDPALSAFHWSKVRIGQALAKTGLTPEMVYTIQCVNDAFRHSEETPEERYVRVLAYLKEKSE